MSTFDDRLRQYQKEAIEAVLKAGKGIVVLPTGAGKTYVAIGVIKRLLRDNKIDHYIVTVPTIFLGWQWASELEKHGLVGSFGYDYLRNNVFTYPTFVKVVDEYIQHTGIRPIESYFGVNVPATAQRVLLVVDEVHHAHKNKRTGQATQLYTAIMKLNPQYAVGLSATISTSGSEEYPFPVVYDKTLKDIRKYMPNVTLYECLVPLTTTNAFLYRSYTQKMKAITQEIDKLSRGPITSDVLSHINKLRRQWTRSVGSRHTVIATDQNVLDVTTALAEYVQGKTIIFTLRIAAMNYLAGVLTQTGKRVIKIKNKNDATNLKNIPWDIIIAVKKFSEGIDLPETDNVIMSSYPAELRTVIQEIGRGMRGPTNKMLNVYFVAEPDTYTPQVVTAYMKFIDAGVRPCPISL